MESLLKHEEEPRPRAQTALVSSAEDRADSLESSGESARTAEMVIRQSKSVPDLSDIVKFKVKTLQDVPKLYEMLVARGIN